jgi:DNA-binding MarR family transcriptional regulator
MIDPSQTPIPVNSIRGLLQDFTLHLDRMISEQRQGTPYEKVRQSDIRVFISAARRSQSVSDIAREMDVSRQAIHSSVKRLMAFDVVELVPQPGNHKEKLVAVSVHGQDARNHVIAQIDHMEAQCRAIIGVQGLETLRALLLALVLGLRAKEGGPKASRQSGIVE